MGARIFASALPVALANRALSLAANGDEWHFALHGGEDYELLFTVPRDRGEPVSRKCFAAKREPRSRS